MILGTFSHNLPWFFRHRSLHCFLEIFLMEMAPKMVQGNVHEAPPRSTLVRRSTFGCILVAHWLTSGSLLAPFGFLVVPFGCLLASFGSLLANFWCPLAHFLLTLAFDFLNCAISWHFDFSKLSNFIYNPIFFYIDSCINVWMHC